MGEKGGGGGGGGGCSGLGTLSWGGGGGNGGRVEERLAVTGENTRFRSGLYNCRRKAALNRDSPTC